MFLFPPKILIKWLGYCSEGDFFHHLFWVGKKHHSLEKIPDPKTLNIQYARALREQESTQFRNWVQTFTASLEKSGIDLEFDAQERVPLNQVHIRCSWLSIWQGLERSQCYPHTSRYALELLRLWIKLLDDMEGADDQKRYDLLLHSVWIQAAMSQMGKSDVLLSLSQATGKFEDEPSVARLVHYLNLYHFLQVLAVLDAENCLDHDSTGQYSMFGSLLPTLPLQEWHPHKSGIFECYFRYFDSREQAYEACTDENKAVDATKTAIKEYFAGKRNINWKTARGWFENMRKAIDVLKTDRPRKKDISLFITLQRWGVADILCGWVGTLAGKHKRLRPSDKGHFKPLGAEIDGEFQAFWTDEQWVASFACYPALFADAVSRIQQKRKDLETDGLQVI
jgi:hypothetical protein